ncbi:MAG TPA: hypothetical protein VM901_03375 [Bdellovibrionota bacterium]|nr:hypothetical protein [Bdellovibrionota bacterium]
MLKLRNGLPTLLVLSYSAHAGTFSDVIESYRQNRYSLANGSGSYSSADPADRKVIEQYYSELESAALMSPITNALEVTAANSQAMVSAIQRAVDATDTISADVEGCMRSRDLSIPQNILSRGARTARAQLEAGYSRSRYVAPVQLDLDGVIDAYNQVNARDWTAEFLRCCKREALNSLQRSGTTDRRQQQVAALRSANESQAGRLSELIEDNGCNQLGAEIADKQNTFATQDYFLPSRVVDPLEGIKMSPVELAETLRNSSVRSALRRVREDAHSPTQSMMEETSYFEEIDTACKVAKEKEANKANSFWRTLAKTGANAAICHVIPYIATNNWSTNKANAAYMVADLTTALPWKDLQCDPGVTALYRSQRPTDPNVVADKWNIPELQNPVYLNRLRAMVPLQQPFPIVRSPDGSIILPGGMLGGDAPTREQVEAQLAAQRMANTPFVRYSTASRQSGTFNPTGFNPSSRLAFLSAPTGSMHYVRPANATLASGRGLAAAVNGVRSLASNVSSANTRAPQSAAALKQNAIGTRSLAAGIIGAQKGRGLAALGQARTLSATQTRNLLSRSIASKSSRVSAEWIARVLRDQRSNSGGGSTVGGGNGPRRVQPNQDKNQQIADEVYKANQRRRETLQAQADAMIKSIQSAVTRSAEIVREIQAKIQARDVAFNKTVEEMVKKPPKSQYKMVSMLITQDGARMQSLAALKAEYDALSSSIPMLTSSLNRLGGLNSQITSNVSSGLSSLTLPTAGTEGRFNGGSGTSVFSNTSSSSIAQPRVQGVDSEFSMRKPTSVLDRLALNLLPQAWAQLAKPGTPEYEDKWSLAYEAFAKDWDSYLKQLRDVEQADRSALVSRYRELSRAPEKLEMQEPDAGTFGLMIETMEVISEESRQLLQDRREDARGDLARVKVYQDVEVAANESEKAIELLGEWGQTYIKSAPETYFNDPQAWEAILPNAILY